MATRRITYLLLVGLAIIAVGLACGYGAVAPIQQSAARTPLGALPTLSVLETQFAQATLFSQPSGGGGPQSTATPAVAALYPLVSYTQTPAMVAPPPAIPESRRLTLEYPPRIRVGDSDTVRLTLEVDTLGNIVPTAEIKGNAIAGQIVQIPNLYDTHDVIAQARLDLAGADIKPEETVNEPLLPGQSVTFYWSIHPTEAGTYRGTVWFYLQFVDKQTGAVSQKTISAQTVQIEATNLFGLSGNAARTTGGVGSILGAILGLPFLDDAVKWLWGRLKLKS